MNIKQVLLALTIVVISFDPVFGSSFRLTSTQDGNNEPTLPVQIKTNKVAKINHDDEERLATSSLLNKWGTGVKTWAKTKQFEMHVKKMVLFTTNPDDTAQKLLREGVTPEQFHSMFKLGNDKNAFLSTNPWSRNYGISTTGYDVWKSLKLAWGRPKAT